MKVVAINGSPNRDEGTTALVLNPFLEGMRQAGAEVDLWYTGDLSIAPLKRDGQSTSTAPGHDSPDDDMARLLPKLAEADILVLASPVYFWGLTGPTKTLLDRMAAQGSTSTAGRATPRRIVLVSTCGSWDMDTFDPLLAQMNAWCRHERLLFTESLLDSGIPVFSGLRQGAGDRIFAGALLRPHAPALSWMIQDGVPVSAVTEAARKAGHQLAADNAIDKKVLADISRPLLPKEKYLHLFHQRFAGLPPAMGQEAGL